MNRSHVLELLDRERRTLARDGETLTMLPELTRLQIGKGAAHLVAFSSLRPESADAIIAREIACHQHLNVGFEWKLYAHDTPPDLGERLRRHGFVPGQKEAVLVYELANGIPTVSADRCTVTRIERHEQLADYRTVAEEAFGEPPAATLAELSAALAAGSRHHVGYVAYVDGIPAAAGRLLTHPASAFGGLYGGGTRPGFRGRGIYRALVAARARDAAEWGATYLQVDALPTSRPILERLGFSWLTDTWPYEWTPTLPSKA